MKKLLAFALLALTFSACEEDAEPAAPKTKAQLLNGMTWRMTEFKRVTGSTTADYFTGYPTCRRDNYFSFKTNGVLEERESNTVCSGNTANQALSASPYTLSADGSKLTIGAAGMGTSSITYDVLTLTSEDLRLSRTGSASGSSYTETMSYTGF